MNEVVEICQPILALLLNHDPISLILPRHFKIMDTENKSTKPEKTALKIKLVNGLKNV
jgi:hypothetical protein